MRRMGHTEEALVPFNFSLRNTLKSLLYVFPYVLLQATSPQTGGQQTGGSLKAMKDKSSQAEKEANEASALKTAGPEGEITAGLWKKLSASYVIRLY